MKWKRVLALVLVFTVSVLQVTAQDASPQTNKQAIRSALAELSAGNPKAVVDLYAETFIFSGEETARDESIPLILEAYTNAIPDLQMIPTVLIAQNDWVASHVTWTGMFSNTLSVEQEIPPTGEPINWTELYFFRFNDEGLVTEFWIVNDPAIRLAQLGVVPSEESESEAAEAAPEEPVGYQLMSEEELAATFSSGMEERNLELFNEQVMLGLAQFPQFYADSYIDWSGDFPSLITTADIEQNAPFAEMLSTAMPDSKITPNIIVAEGDWIAGLGTFSGTFTVDVDFFGTPLTHTDEEIVFQLGVVDRYNADGKIVEEWLEGDYSPLFVGLGLG